MRSSTRAARWEHGSDFHLTLEHGVLEAPWQKYPHVLYGSGRHVLRALLVWGRDRFRWRRVLVPSYFCQEVVAALVSELPVTLYEDDPTKPAPPKVEATATDAVLVVNFFGARRAASIQTDGTIIEDHSHDPIGEWARSSTAAFSMASLRKTLPLPDGGVLWSPAGMPLPAPPPPHEEHLRATLDRLSGMVLKRRYLAGAEVEKSDLRARLVAGEAAIGGGPISGISPFSRARLPSLPVRRWDRRRRRNVRYLEAALRELPGARVLDSPFALTLVFDSGVIRDRVRTMLIAERVYPAVLWPLEPPVLPGIPPHHVELSRRMLSLHCDFRYTAADLTRVADLVKVAMARAASYSRRHPVRRKEARPVERV